ncbi:hypothetical protein [Fructilactobacillus sanfranciscensis]|uniref:hypothetical protein n=1 Tax=Fructilactobacillus sanfranciscensis TaxID=1625 RepID=UPI0013CF676A|nr:hypothetical protein [Fructilactobacillus sanfranciscensis]MDN4462542.1 hypothetical protein [Fructilactobacillus sanfranciscensis]NDR61650.1 hypothetical protein [Fructilactobacillus sanfranciscensis]
MAESDVEIAIQGKLDKIFADYPLIPRLEMLKIEIKRTLMQDTAVKVTDGAEPVDAVREAFQDFGDLRHQINEVLFTSNK